MCIILCKTSYTEKAVQCTGQLVTVDKSELADTQGELPVRMLLGTVYEHTSGTVHGFDGKIHVVYDCCVHLIFIMCPVSRPFPQIPVKYDGS